jgi:hypothetical protein
VRAQAFVKRVREAIRPESNDLNSLSGGNINENTGYKARATSGVKSFNATDREFLRTAERYEKIILPRHRELEKNFAEFLQRRYKNTKIIINKGNKDDMRCKIPNYGEIMIEFKPVNANNVRHEIRTALGQLLDYKQEYKWSGRQLIVVDSAVSNTNDKALALDNRMALAWPKDDGTFEILWPSI